MNIKARLRKIGKTRMAFFLGISVGLVFFLLNMGGCNEDTLENKMIDLRFQLRGEIGPSVTDDIIILTIDDQTMENLNVRWPWPRTVYAKVIDRLSLARAKVVALDFMFSESGKEEDIKKDRLLGDSIIRSRAWIVLASKFYMKVSNIGSQKSYVAALENVDQTKAHVGYVNIWADDDSILRHTHLMKKHHNKLYMSFAMQIVRRYHKIKEPIADLFPDRLEYGPLTIPADKSARMLINYRGGPGNFQMISFDNVYRDFEEDDDGMPVSLFPALLDSEIFKDKIVLVGPTFVEAQDAHSTPFEKISGVEIHANILDTILNNRYLYRAPLWMNILIFFLLPLLITLIAVNMKPIKSSMVMGTVAIAYFFLAAWVFIDQQLIIPLANPLITLVFAYLVTVVYLFMTEQRHAQYIKGMFSRYVSPKVVEQMVKDPNAELKLGGNKQIVTVLFSDIRSFTTLSEELPAEKVVEQLNEYFQTWTEIIFKHDGMVDKFIGDAVMAIFGAPVGHPDDPIRAVRATLEMKDALERLNHSWQAQGKREFRIGVGLNTGEAIVGNMGSHQAMGYTVIGDTVNLASRLEGKTKDLKAFLAISESTYAVVKDLVEVEEHKDISVKGKSKSMSVYSVLGLKKS